MNLAVFGATGATGRHVVKLALGNGHTVRALVRDAAKMSDAGASVTIIESDATVAADIARTVKGCDAIISALGSGNTTLTRFGAALVQNLGDVAAPRVISLVGAGVSMPGDGSGAGRTVMLTLMHMIASGILQDAERHAAILRQSPADWTLVRPPRLTNDEATGRIRHDTYLKLGPTDSIARADLAAFMLDCAETGLYVHAAPMVTNQGK